MSDDTIQTTYKVVSWDGEVSFITAYCESDAYQQAFEFASNSGGIQDFGPM
jgi:hypothetical protein